MSIPHPFQAADASQAASFREAARRIIQFDAEVPSTHAPQSHPIPAVNLASERNPIPWPDGTAPTPTPLPAVPPAAAPLPRVTTSW